MFIGHYWSLLVTIGHYWSLLVTIGHYWSLLVTIGHYPKHFYPVPLRSILISSALLHVGLPSDIFSSGFPSKTLYVSVLSRCTCCIPNQTHPPRLDHAIIFTEQFESWSSCFAVFSNPLFPRRAGPYYSLHLTDQIRHPHKTTVRYTISCIIILILPDCTVSCPKYQ